MKDLLAVLKLKETLTNHTNTITLQNSIARTISSECTARKLLQVNLLAVDINIHVKFFYIMQFIQNYKIFCNIF